MFRKFEVLLIFTQNRQFMNSTVVFYGTGFVFYFSLSLPEENPVVSPTIGKKCRIHKFSILCVLSYTQN